MNSSNDHTHPQEGEENNPHEKIPADPSDTCSMDSLAASEGNPDLPDPIRKLADFLRNRRNGPLNDEDSNRASWLLIEGWDSLRGSGATGMCAEKAGRAENLRVKGGCLCFDIERHGACSYGSTRAEVYTWRINCDSMEASLVGATHRQVTPAAKGWTKENALTEAQRVFDLLRKGTPHPGIICRRDGSINVVMTRWIPDSFPDTMTGRRRRFREAVKSLAPGNGLAFDPVSNGIVLRRVDS